ncbi:MAG: hypothetical protein GX800_08745 [Clostridiaceae bacterium]|nr:hypothetical protein [Clostridiaceae bacterium]
MRKILYFLAGFILSSTLFICYINFLPVGSIDGKTIYKYQLNQRLAWAADNTIKNIGKDLAFEKAMSDLGIHVSDAEISKEWDSMVEHYGGIDELCKILIDTRGNEDSLKSNIKKGILQQKAIKHFAASVLPDENNIDFQMEEGARLYEKYIKEYEEKVVIKIY